LATPSGVETGTQLVLGSILETVYSYGGLSGDLLTKVQYADGTTEGYEYDALGEVLAEKDRDGTRRRGTAPSASLSG